MNIIKLNLFDFDENYITSFVLKLTQLQKLERDKSLVSFKYHKSGVLDVKLGFPDSVIKYEEQLGKIFLERSYFNYGFGKFS